MTKNFYLENKGELTIPPTPLRDVLLKNYAEFICPHMPLLDFHGLITTIDRNNSLQAISLLLFQAIMFASVVTVDMRYLKAAVYTTRRDVRREFFQKARLLLDFDYELDRVSIIQSLLLMTYCHKTACDQKESDYWMSIAMSLENKIGLHRNPEKSLLMDPARQRLWKRIWWSIYMRDRLIALGLRRPTRIENGDFDVSMLTLDDFEVRIAPDINSCISRCEIMRDIEMQRQLAVICIEKAKLCIVVSNVLSVQYSVFYKNHGELSEGGCARGNMTLVAKTPGRWPIKWRAVTENFKSGKTVLPKKPETELQKGFI